MLWNGTVLEQLFFSVEQILSQAIDWGVLISPILVIQDVSNLSRNLAFRLLFLVVEATQYGMLLDVGHMKPPCLLIRSFRTIFPSMITSNITGLIIKWLFQARTWKISIPKNICIK